MTKTKHNIKSRLQAAMYLNIEEKMASLSQAIASIQESKLNETKSSAGDKFETGRAMMQQELDRIESQMDMLNVTKNRLKQMSSFITHDRVVAGAIVITDSGNFYISVSLGKVKVEDELYYTVSPEAPLSKVFLNKKSGDRVEFRGRIYYIKNVM